MVYAVRFLKISRRLSILFILIEKPLVLLLLMLALLCCIYLIFCLTAHNLWGAEQKSFRTMTMTVMNNFQLFALKADGIVGTTNDLYENKAFWGIIFLISYILLIEFSFMNIFTSIFFERQRITNQLERTLYMKFPHVRNTKSKPSFIYF